MNVAIIPARGGSQRIPRKNIKPFHGKPIIAYSIESAKASGLFDGGVWVSTEDDEICGEGFLHGAGWIRRAPEYAEIGTPDCGTQEVVRQALLTCREQNDLEMASVGKRSNPEPDYVCCIYATAPLLAASDLRIGYNELVEHDLDFVYVEGWYYWGKAEAFLAGRPLHGEKVVRIAIPERWIDINTHADWVRAELMYAALYKQVA